MSRNKHHEGEAGASEARRTANRANAQRSTGPRTAAGKARSSRNATRHGAYAEVGLAIESGPFAEDAEEVAALMEAVVKSLRPRDLFEEALAQEIALAYVRARRLNYWEASVLEAEREESAMMAATLEDRAEDFVLEAIYQWNERRRTPGQEPTGDDEPPWDLMAAHLKESVARKRTITGLWDATRKPNGAEEWQRAFKTLARHCFRDADDLADWLADRDGELARTRTLRDETTRRQVANRSIEAMDRVDAVRSRNTNTIGKKMKMLADLQQRDLK